MFLKKVVCIIVLGRCRQGIASYKSSEITRGCLPRGGCAVPSTSAIPKFLTTHPQVFTLQQGMDSADQGSPIYQLSLGTQSLQIAMP